MEEQKNSSVLSLSASILIAGVLISGSIIYVVGKQNQSPSAGGGNLAAAVGNLSAGADDLNSVLKIGGRDVILGDPNAPVAIVEYGDYQCPFCGKFFEQTESLIRENYIANGKAKLVYRSLAFLGEESISSSLAAECAKDQGKFWTYHDALYKAEIADGAENNGNLNRDLFLRLAGDLKLNVPDFTTCYDGNKYASEIAQVRDRAESAGVNSTPTTFVNGEKVKGAVSFDSIKAVIDKYLAGK